MDISVPRDYRLSYMYHSASNMMPIGDPRDGVFYLTLMMDPYNFSHISRSNHANPRER